MTLAIDTLVWLGAGDGQQSGLIDIAAKAILVEARADSVKASQKLFANQANIRVEHLMLAAKQGEADFYHYNLPEFSALSEVTGLKQLFPGIRLAQTSKVTTAAVDDFISKLALDSDKTNLLVLDIIDQSLPLLQSLASAGLLTTFNQLQLPASNEPLYQGAATAEEITEFLARHGYEVTNTDSSDPDLPVLSFRLNSLWHKLVTSNKLQVTLEQQLKAEQSNKATLEQQLAKLKQQSEQDKAELLKQLAASQQQAASEQRQLVESSNKLLAKAEQAEQNNTKILQQAEEQKLQYEQKLADISKQLTNNVSENETLQQQLSAAKVAAEKDKAELCGQIKGMDAELKKVLQELHAANQQLSSATEQKKEHEQELAKQQLVNQQSEQLKQEATELQKKITKDNAKLQADFEQVSKHAASRLDKIARLEKINRQLNEANTQLAKRQKALEQEMLKAQAQIDIIKELLLK